MGKLLPQKTRQGKSHRFYYSSGVKPQDFSELAAKNIGLIVNCSGNVYRSFEDTPIPYVTNCIIERDVWGKAPFYRAAKAYLLHQNANTGVLFHCKAGITRSRTNMAVLATALGEESILNAKDKAKLRYMQENGRVGSDIVEFVSQVLAQPNTPLSKLGLTQLELPRIGQFAVDQAAFGYVPFFLAVRAEQVGLVVTEPILQAVYKLAKQISISHQLKTQVNHAIAIGQIPGNIVQFCKIALEFPNIEADRVRNKLR